MGYREQSSLPEIIYQSVKSTARYINQHAAPAAEATQEAYKDAFNAYTIYMMREENKIPFMGTPMVKLTEVLSCGMGDLGSNPVVCKAAKATLAR